MRVQSVMVCEGAQIENGKLFILGGGLATLWVTQYPSTMTTVIAAVLEIDPDLDQGDNAIALRVRASGTGEVLAEVEVNVNVEGPMEAAMPILIPVAQRLEFVVPSPMQVDVTIESADSVDVRIPLAVLPVPTG
jgi:hypothetical protein